MRGRLSPPPPNTTTLGLSAHVCPHQPLHWLFRWSDSKCDSVSFVVHQDLKSSSSLVVKLYQTARAVKVCKVLIQLFSHPACLHAKTLHQTRLQNLIRHCDGLLSTVREYSQRFIGTEAGAEADEIERWVYPLCFTISDRSLLINPCRTIERILGRVSGWARLSEAAAFLKQNDVQNGIEDCHRELAACTDRFMVCWAYAT